MKLIEEGATEQVAEDNRGWILAGGLLLPAVGIGSMLETVVATGQVSDGIAMTLVGLATLTSYAIKRRQFTAAPDERAPEDDVERPPDVDAPFRGRPAGIGGTRSRRAGRSRRRG